jgi:hypothetical protein
MRCSYRINDAQWKRHSAGSLNGRRRLARGTGLLAILAVMSAFLSVTSAQATECNETLRSALSSTLLPDCRAYEMVTPLYKEGYPLFAQSYSTGGETAILVSLASLGGNSGSSEQLSVSGVYSATRIDTGWKLTPLNAPLSKFVGQLPVSQAAEADRGETLWEQHEPQQSPAHVDLYARSSEGDYSLIGPLNPHESTTEEANDVIQADPSLVDHPVATTYDYGHVILEANFNVARWPIDETIGGDGHSLYEYSGIDNKEPRLVAVEGGQNSTQLIGVCGATLGAGVAQESVNAYNALSDSGERVFFTVAPSSVCNETPAPSQAEIYEREEGATANAKTVHVSASECTLECGAEESGKNFEGASASGERVFFTSTQKLTNNAVDGTVSGNAAEGGGCASTAPAQGGCNLYEYNASHLTLVAGGEVLGVVGVAEDGSHVYFVKRVPEELGGELVEDDKLYVYDARKGTTTYIATLSNTDERDWSREFSRPVEVVGKTGRFLLFASSRKGLTADDASEQTQLFEYKAEAEGEPSELVRVTKGEDGFNDNGNGAAIGVALSSVESVAARLGDHTDFKSTANRLSVSTDGDTVIFRTAGELSPRAGSATQECTSIYEFHSDGPLVAGSVHLISDGKDTQLYKGFTCGAQFQAIDATGNDILFNTVDSLVPQDIDGGQRDIYDARVNGGFTPAPTAEICNGRYCEGPSSIPLPPPEASSVSNPSEALLAAPIATAKTKIKKKGKTRKKAGSCRHGFVKKRNKCFRHHTEARKPSRKRGK